MRARVRDVCVRDVCVRDVCTEQPSDCAARVVVLCAVGVWAKDALSMESGLAERTVQTPV